ncbi:MAG: hypothetical protein ACYC27_21910 [Armatimonadota bacterium]
MRRTVDRDEEITARLAVIEEKMEILIAEVTAVRRFIPGTMVEHTERIDVLGRNIRTIQWLGGVLAVTLIGAFIEHILGG